MRDTYYTFKRNGQTCMSQKANLKSHTNQSLSFISKS